METNHAVNNFVQIIYSFNVLFISLFITYTAILFDLNFDKEKLVFDVKYLKRIVTSTFKIKNTFRKCKFFLTRE